jgi:hypothetical protein
MRFQIIFYVLTLIVSELTAIRKSSKWPLSGRHNLCTVQLSPCIVRLRPYLPGTFRLHVCEPKPIESHRGEDAFFYNNTGFYYSCIINNNNIK